ncbi:hypothetical protein K2Y11_24395 [bacterium]|nr:hypothetical protein [bacterium]
MGTRADFYVGKNETAEWLGSVAWDGYREGIDDAVLNAKSEEEFRAAVAKFASERDDWTAPEQGWPWPWDTSEISDCSYWFFNGQVYDDQSYGNQDNVYMPLSIKTDEETGEWPEGLQLEKITFPNMAERKNVTLGARSGLMIIGFKE